MSERRSIAPGSESEGQRVVRLVEEALGLDFSAKPTYTSEAIFPNQAPTPRQRESARLFMSKMSFYLEPFILDGVEIPDTLLDDLRSMYELYLSSRGEAPESYPGFQPFDLIHVAGEAQYHVAWFAELGQYEDSDVLARDMTLYEAIQGYFEQLAASR